MSINIIMQSLKELVQIHERLIQLSEKKTEIIKAGSAEDLQQILVLEAKLVNKLEHAENNRQTIVNNWFTEKRLLEEEWTLTRMLELIEQEQDVVNLEKITTTLTKAITKLKQQEQLNANLI